MVAIAVNRFHARFRAADGQQQRLRRILGLALDEGLDAAVGRGGFADSGEICIREIHAIARLDLAETDANLAARLALAIADAIESGSGQPGAGLVRYASRAQALADFAASTLGGDFSRAWAWRQLGISQTAFAASTADAARQVLQALGQQPVHAIAALASVASDPVLFGRLLRDGPVAQWRALARRVVEAMGGDAAILLVPVQDAIPPGLAEVAGQWARQSVIARAALAFRRVEPIAEASLMAVFVMAETEPALLQLPAAAARARVQAVASVLAQPARPQEAGQRMQTSQPKTMERPILDATDTGKPGVIDVPLSIGGKQPEPAQQNRTLPEPAQATRTPFLLDGPTGQTFTADALDLPVPVLADVDVPVRLQTHSSATPESNTLETQAAGKTPLMPRKHNLPDTRQQAQTAFGGLLFFIHVANQTGLAGRIVSEPRLEQRSPRWCLRQLALNLVPAAPTDPAVLAFAGWLPDSEPPDEPPPEVAEQAALDGLRDSLLDALRERLARTGLAEVGLVDFVCRRPADIIADPGWLETHFALDGVSTEIRAAGLDLDPGWVPWLGLVIRFVYG